MPKIPLNVTPGGATLDIAMAPPLLYMTATSRPATWTALVDTGAMLSVISPKVRAALAPPSLGYEAIARAGGVATYEPVYEVRIRLGSDRVRFDDWFNLSVIEIQPATPRIDVILGMDLLIKLKLSLSGPSRSGWLQYE